MMRTERKAAAAASPLAVLLGFEVAAIVGLHALGSSHAMQVPWGNLTTWLSTGSIDEVAAPLIRVSALAIAYWMFVSTALTVVAQISRIPAAVRATSMFTLPSVRRVVDSAMVVSIATTSVVGMGGTPVGAQTDGTFGDVTTSVPAVSEQLSVATPRFSASQVDELTSTSQAETTTTMAEETTTTAAQFGGDVGGDSVSTPRPTTSGGDTTTTTTTTAPTTSTTAAPFVEEAAPAPAPEPVAAAEVLGASEYRVVAGDNLWTIAHDTLEQAGAGHSEAEVRDYWLVLIEANRDNLRSNDPHWIFPGEVIELPPIGAPAS